MSKNLVEFRARGRERIKIVSSGGMCVRTHTSHPEFSDFFDSLNGHPKGVAVFICEFAPSGRWKVPAGNMAKIFFQNLPCRKWMKEEYAAALCG